MTIKYLRETTLCFEPGNEMPYKFKYGWQLLKFIFFGGRGCGGDYDDL